MTHALLLGALGAVVWGIGSMLSAPSSRILGVGGSVLWLSASAALAGAALALSISGPPQVATRDIPYLALAVLTLLAATHLWALVIQRSDVSVATPIVACDGAVAAVIAVVAGHRLPLVAYAGMAMMVGGLIVLSHRQSARRPPSGNRYEVERPFSRPATVAIAALTATCFGALFYCSGHVEGTSPLWTVTIVRAGVTVVALARAVPRALSPAPAGLWFAAAAGLLDVSGFALYVAGARHDLAVAAVAVSQYGAIAVLASVVYLRERLTRRQWTGTAVLLLGAAVVALGGQ
jgi:drug/metabolite transporter (DMT)-like permease